MILFIRGMNSRNIFLESLNYNVLKSIQYCPISFAGTSLFDIGAHLPKINFIAFGCQGVGFRAVKLPSTGLCIYCIRAVFSGFNYLSIVSSLVNQFPELEL